jgi:hypothetical protein
MGFSGLFSYLARSKNTCVLKNAYIWGGKTKELQY